VSPAEAKRLLAAAGYPNGFPATMCFTTYGSTVLVDLSQLILKHLKDVGIDARLDQKEYGAYIRVADRLHAAAVHPGRRRPAHAG
jgi:ABC-type transport system substrate-binding protein